MDSLVFDAKFVPQEGDPFLGEITVTGASASACKKARDGIRVVDVGDCRFERKKKKEGGLAVFTFLEKWKDYVLFQYADSEKISLMTMEEAKATSRPKKASPGEDGITQFDYERVKFAFNRGQPIVRRSDGSEFCITDVDLKKS